MSTTTTETWAEQEAKRETLEADRRQALHEACRDIATWLGDPWRYVERGVNEDGEPEPLCEWGALLHGNGERDKTPRLCIARVWDKQDRYEIRAEFPGVYEHLSMKDRDGKWVITVAASKTPKQIAKDIERRLFPGYLEAYAAGRAARDAVEAEDAARDAAAAELVELLQGHGEIRSQKYGHAQHGIAAFSARSPFYGDLETRRNLDGARSADFTISNLTMEEARAICAVLVRRPLT